jgi:hypothetical protein
LPIGHVGRFEGHHAVFRPAFVFGVSAKIQTALSSSRIMMNGGASPPMSKCTPSPSRYKIHGPKMAGPIYLNCSPTPERSQEIDKSTPATDNQYHAEGNQLDTNVRMKKMLIWCRLIKVFKIVFSYTFLW